MMSRDAIKRTTWQTDPGRPWEGAASVEFRASGGQWSAKFILYSTTIITVVSEN